MRIRIPKLGGREVAFTKRHRFIVGVLACSILLFLSEYSLGRSGIIFILGISLLSDIFMFWGMGRDLRENFSPQVFILPFFFSMAVGLFYFLVPERLIVRMIITLLYGFGLYSLYLSQNIFIVSSIRTIALLSSARTVSFFIAVVSYFLLTNVIFSLHLIVFLTIPMVFASALPLIIHSVWTYTLDRDLKHNLKWGIMLGISITEVALLLWFWPSTPTYIALFLTGVFYIIIGLSHVWLEKRLFRAVMLEYIWVGAFVLIFLVSFTSWN